MDIDDTPLAAAAGILALTAAALVTFGLPAVDLETIAGGIGQLAAYAVLFGHRGQRGDWAAAERVWAAAGALQAVGLDAAIQLAAGHWLHVAGPHVEVAAAQRRDVALRQRVAVGGIAVGVAAAVLWDGQQDRQQQVRWRWGIGQMPQLPAFRSAWNLGRRSDGRYIDGSAIPFVNAAAKPAARVKASLSSRPRSRAFDSGSGGTGWSTSWSRIRVPSSVSTSKSGIEAPLLSGCAWERRAHSPNPSIGVRSLC